MGFFASQISSHRSYASIPRHTFHTFPFIDEILRFACEFLVVFSMPCIVDRYYCYCFASVQADTEFQRRATDDAVLLIKWWGKNSDCYGLDPTNSHIFIYQPHLLNSPPLPPPPSCSSHHGTFFVPSSRSTWTYSMWMAFYCFEPCADCWFVLRSGFIYWTTRLYSTYINSVYIGCIELAGQSRRRECVGFIREYFWNIYGISLLYQLIKSMVLIFVQFLSP